MAFTSLDVIKGALFAWLAFMIILTLGLTVFAFSVQAGTPSAAFVATGYAIIVTFGHVVLYAGGIGLGVMAALTPVAWVIGRMLRRRGSLPRRLLAHTVLGGAVAGLAGALLALIGLIGWDLWAALHDPVVAFCFVAMVISVPIGWWISARGALRDHRASGRGEQLSSRGDVDALFGATRS